MEKDVKNAFNLHKQTSCPLDECVKALKMEDPIDYLKDKARVRGEKIKETELKLHPCTCGGEMEMKKVARNGGMDGTYWDWELTCKKCGLTRIYAADDFYGRKYKTFEEVVDDWNRNKKKEPCEDTVSRKDVQEAVENAIAKYIPMLVGECEKLPLELAMAIKNTPPATSKVEASEIDEIKEVEPTMVYPIKENHVYALCECRLPLSYGLDLGEKQPGKHEYRFKCKCCGLSGVVHAGQKVRMRNNGR